MIYNLVTNVLVPGKMNEFFGTANELLPLYPKLSMKLAASWHSYTGNMNMMYSLYVWDDLAAYQKSIEAQRKNADFQKIMAKLSTLIVSMNYTLLEPNQWSPMK